MNVVDFSGKTFMDYNKLEIIEIPERKTFFPTDQDLDTINQDELKLSEIRLKQNGNGYQMNAI